MVLVVQNIEKLNCRAFSFSYTIFLLHLHICISHVIQSVTLGDEEANRRGVQKTVLERKGPSTFSCGVEIISKTELRVHRSLEATVDAILRGILLSC